MNSSSLFIVTFSGRDAPGITSGITKILAESQTHVIDIGQAVLHGWLSLSLLIQPSSPAVLIRLSEMAQRLNLKIDHEVFQAKDLSNGAPPPTPYRYALTLIAQEISAQTLYQVTHYLSSKQINIDLIERLSEGKFGCIEMLVSSQNQVNATTVQHELLALARQEGVDIALQTEGLYRRAKRLIVFDMDSTLIQSEIIDEFAREMGVYEKVAKVTHEAMTGRVPFTEALKKRVALLRGLRSSQIDAVFERTRLTPGATELIGVLKDLGYRIALISGGFSCIADRLKAQLGIHYAYANQLILQEGVCTGEVCSPIIDSQRKADLLELIAQQEGIHLDQVIAVGDGANDIPMLEKAGLGIAFNAKAAVNERADLALSQKNLTTILYLLGISGRDLPQILG